LAAKKTIRSTSGARGAIATAVEGRVVNSLRKPAGAPTRR
jgi:hypothetical protein